MSRAFGLRRPLASRARVRFSNVQSSTPVPEGADLTPYTYKVLNQGEIGSCVAHGVPGAACTTLAAAGHPLGFIPSVRFAYQTCLRLDRARDYPHMRPPHMPELRDRGTRILTCVDALARYGAIDGGSDCLTTADATAVSRYPIARAIQAATKLLVGAYTLDTPDDAARALAAGYGVAIGGYVSSEFLAYGPSSPPIGAQDITDPFGGGHCVELAGFETVADERLWKIKNSWGVGWGRQGFAMVTDEYLRQQWEMVALSVRVAS